MKEPSRFLEAVPRRPLLRQVARPTGVFIAILVTAVAGFRTLDGVGVVDGLFWLIDPGGIPQYFRENDGPESTVKLYAVFVFFGLIATGLWLVETVISAIFGGRIHEEFRDMKNKQRIEDYQDHVVVCGYGTFGRTIVGQLREKDRDVVIVERHDDHYRRILDEGLVAVNGDARREGVLRAAGVERAETVVGAIDDAKTNLQIAVVADRLASDPDLVVRAGNEMDRSLARQVGISNVIIPEILSGIEVGRDI